MAGVSVISSWHIICLSYNKLVQLDMIYLPLF